MNALVFRLLGPADVVVWAAGSRAWVLDRSHGETWVPLVDPPVATAGSLLTRSAVAALVARVGTPF